jgi:O-antigen/teichoic acid export membrane protein
MLSQVAQLVRSLRGSRSYRTNTINSLFGVLDYLIQGLAMLVAASFLVRRFGLSQYGLWMLATAVISSMESISSGFGDATVRFVSKYRGRDDHVGVARIICATLTINGALGLVLAAGVVLGAEFVVTHIFTVEPPQYMLSVRMLQVAGVILLLRSIENVFSNTLRAYERYGRTVSVSIAARFLNVAAAVILAYFGQTVLVVMQATLVIAIITLCLQYAAVKAVCGSLTIMPKIDSESFYEIFEYGIFSWMQALAGVIYYHADRLVVGAMLGTSALGVYAVCIQATQPIHGIASAALNFIFPHFSARRESGASEALTRVLSVCTWVNIGLVVLLSAPLIFFGREILSIWMGTSFAEQGAVVLTWLAIAYAALGASVASHYILLALGQARFVAFVNILGGTFSIACIVLLIPRYGLLGAALGRLFYASAIALNFWQLGKLRRDAPADFSGSHSD